MVDFIEPYVGQVGGYIVDFHTVDFFPERYFDLVVYLRVDNTVLYDRLLEREYSEAKILENSKLALTLVDCEILNVLRDEVFESYKPEIILEMSNNSTEQMEPNL